MERGIYWRELRLDGLQKFPPWEAAMRVNTFENAMRQRVYDVVTSFPRQRHYIQPCTHHCIEYSISQSFVLAEKDSAPLMVHVERVNGQVYQNVLQILSTVSRIPYKDLGGVE